MGSITASMLKKYSKKFFIGKLLLITFLVVISSVAYQQLLGQKDYPLAPNAELILPLIQNNQLSSSSSMLKAYESKVVLLDFWASWCGPCRQSFPWMNGLQKKYEQDGFVVVAVNVDLEPALAYEFLASVPAQFDVLLDSRAVLQNSFKVIGMPTSFLIDRKGRVRATHLGFHMSRIKEYEDDIKRLLFVQ